jgi:hypothetical protein
MKKKVIWFAVSFGLTLASLYLAFNYSYDFHQLAWTQVFWIFIWFSAAVYGLLVSNYKLQYFLGILAAMLIGFVVPLVFHVWPWH